MVPRFFLFGRRRSMHACYETIQEDIRRAKQILVTRWNTWTRLQPVLFQGEAGLSA
jgi:hypothetical protein